MPNQTLLTRLFVPNARWRWFVLALLWTLIGLVCAAQVQLFPGEVSLPKTLVYTLPIWWLWLLLTPAIVWLAKRFRLDRPEWLRAAPVHVVVGITAIGLHLAFFAWWTEVVGPYGSREQPLWEGMKRLAMGAWLQVDLLAYGAILGGTYGAEYYRKFRERERLAAQLETRLAQAQLHALKMQLHPHFLFNTLNAISTVVLQGEADKATRMLARLSTFLRATLDASDDHFTSLKAELAFIKEYLALEQIRFQDRLSIDWAIAPQTEIAQVPTLVLQPLVENALQHGIAQRESDGLLTIRSRLRAGHVVLEVEDNGPGLLGGAPEDGVGLGNTRTRLTQHYGENFTLKLTNQPHGGLCAHVAFPFHRYQATS